MNIIDYSDTLTVEQRLAQLRMDEIREESLEGWSVHLLTKFFPLYRIRKPVYLGSLTWSSPAIKTRWMLHKDAILTRGGYANSANLARDYLEYKFGGQRRRTSTKQYNALVKVRRSPPLFAFPCDISDAVYIDIDAAYWTILRIVGWDVDYLPGRFLGVKSDVEDFPYPYLKLSRNSLVSAGLPAKVNLWDGEKLKLTRIGNKYTNLVLWGLVQDVLNGVASDLIDVGAVYGFTDGFILPANKLKIAAHTINSWGLNCSVRHWGRGRVYGTGNYAIGTFKTRRDVRVPKFFRNVTPVEPEWLRKRMFAWSIRRGILTDTGEEISSRIV